MKIEAAVKRIDMQKFTDKQSRSFIELVMHNKLHRKNFVVIVLSQNFRAVVCAPITIRSVTEHNEENH